MPLSLVQLLVAAFTLALCSTTWADDKPPVFSDKGLDEVLAASKGTDKIVVAKATASWCGPCKVMDRTTWRDAGVVAWFKDNGTAVQFDVDDEKGLAKRYAIRAMPTMIAFKNGEEFDRIVGGKQAPEFLAWLEGVKRGEKAGDALMKRRAAGGLGARERLDLARELLHGGKHAEALVEYEWLWFNILKLDPAMVGVRVSFMAGEMQRLAEEHEPARARFGAMRDEIEARLKGERKSWDDLGDWIVLNEVTGDEDRTLAWIDRIKVDPTAAPTLRRFSFRIKNLLVSHERYADLALIIDRPLKDVQDAARMMKMQAGMQPQVEGLPPEVAKQVREMPVRMFRESVGPVYAGMLAAGRHEEAAQVATEALKHDDTGPGRTSLVSWAIRAKCARPEVLRLLDDAAERGEDVSGLRRQLDALNTDN